MKSIDLHHRYFPGNITKFRDIPENSMEESFTIFKIITQGYVFKFNTCEIFRMIQLFSASSNKRKNNPTPRYIDFNGCDL